MKNKLILAVMAVEATLSAATGEAVRRLDVCTEAGTDPITLRQAEATTSEILGTAGVRLVWHDSRRCPAGSVRIDVKSDTPRDAQPGSMARAWPYEGTHIEIFYDRVQLIAGPSRIRPVLAHVMAHEITHILQGVACHADSGVMKAKYENTDMQEMMMHPLRYTPQDVLLIHSGFDSRNLISQALVENRR